MKIKTNVLNYKDPNTGEYVAVPVVVSGDSENVTAENIVEALGYTPANEEVVDELNEKLVQKIADFENICFTKENVNLFDGVENLGYINSKGEIVGLTGSWRHTNKIPVLDGDIIQSNITTQFSDGGWVVNAYDLNGDFLYSGKRTFPFEINWNGFVVVPFNINDENYNNIQIQKGNVLYPDGFSYTLKSDALLSNESFLKVYNSKLKGLILNCLGDSFTSDETHASNWTRVIEKRTGCIVNNYGVSGTPIGSYYSDNVKEEDFVHRFKTMSDDCDIVLVLGGLNDSNNLHATQTWEQRYGNINDESGAYTVYGQMKALLNGLLEKYSDKLIVFITPPHVPYSTYTIKLDAIVQAQREVIAQIGGVKLIDLYAGCRGFSTNIEQQKIYHDLSNDTNTFYDGIDIHPNSNGHKMIAEEIETQLIQMLL